VADHPEAFRHDPRARLYIEYLDYVQECAPLAVLMENVPDILNHGGHNIAEEISDVLVSRGYTCGYTLLNAARYGVPQMRERMFLIAYRKELDQIVDFPKPTHWVDLPPGYEGSRAVALKLLSNDLFADNGHYVLPPEASKALQSAVTAKQAIGDLPTIYARKLLDEGTLVRGARRLNIPVAFTRPRSVSQYAALMRSWPGFGAKASLYDHVIRYLPRDYELFSRLQPGDQYPQAHACAEKMFEQKLTQLKKKRAAPEIGSAAWRKLRDSVVPPYDPDKFPNKWRKMEEDWPARTLMAHLGKDSYSHIHYDSNQARTISVREAARLQSFPDGFAFSGTMNPAFKQIGNAVPPLLARHLAETLVKKLRAGVSLGNFGSTVGVKEAV
jgi:DNA (cytosine-5)-methyltransferase 1